MSYTLTFFFGKADNHETHLIPHTYYVTFLSFSYGSNFACCMQKRGFERGSKANPGLKAGALGNGNACHSSPVFKNMGFSGNNNKQIKKPCRNAFLLR